MLRPLNDHVLVRRVAADEVTRGGIIIPDAAKEKPTRGEVLAVGPGRLLENGQRVAVDVQVGDLVLFGKYRETEVTIDGEKRLVVREEDILAVLDGESTT